MGYLLLLSGVAAGVAIVYLGRLAGRWGVDPLGLMLGACLTAGVATGAAMPWVYGAADVRPFFTPAVWATVGFTAATGLVGTVCYWVALARGPSGPVATITSLQLLVPIVLSMAFWGEQPTPVRAAGIALAVLSLVLMNVGKPPEQPPKLPPKRRAGEAAEAPAAEVPGVARGGAWKTMAVAGMLLMGLTNASFKFKQVHFGAMPDPLYLVIYWLLCTACLLAVVRARRRPISRRGWLAGVAIGVALIPANFGILSSLRYLNPTAVYLVGMGTPPVLVVILSAVFLRERYPRRVQAAVAAGLVAVCLMIL